MAKRPASPFANTTAAKPTPVPATAARRQALGRVENLETPAAQALAKQNETAAPEVAAAPEPRKPGRLADGKVRIPLGMLRSKFPPLPERPDFHRRWLNDTEGRISQALNAGYTHVLDEKGKPFAVHGGTLKTGAAFQVFAMEQPMEYFDEDFETKQLRRDEVDRRIYGGTYNEEPDDKRYVPRHTPINVSVRTGSGRD